MTTTKDTLPRIADFLPAGDTSAAIRAAFFRLTAAAKANAEQTARLEADRPAALMAGQIERHEAHLAKRRIFSEQCVIAEKELRRLFTTAKEGEEDVDYSAKLAELKAVEASWNADLAEQYPTLTAGLIALLTREADLLRGFNELSRMPGAARSKIALGATMDHPSGAMARGYLGANYISTSLGEMTRLPSLSPGPALWGGRP